MIDVGSRKADREFEHEIIARIRAVTGQGRQEARITWLASIRAIAEALLDGHEVYLRGLGKLYFGYYGPPAP